MDVFFLKGVALQEKKLYNGASAGKKILQLMTYLSTTSRKKICEYNLTTPSPRSIINGPSHTFGFFKDLFQVM